MLVTMHFRFKTERSILGEQARQNSPQKFLYINVRTVGLINEAVLVLGYMEYREPHVTLSRKE